MMLALLPPGIYFVILLKYSIIPIIFLFFKSRIKVESTKSKHGSSKTLISKTKEREIERIQITKNRK